MKLTRTGWLAAMAGITTLAPLSSIYAQDAAPVRLAFNIQPQPVGDALNVFASQSGMQVLFLSELGKDITAPPVQGTLSPEQALERLLAGSGLQYEFINPRTVTIRTVPKTSGGPAREADIPRETGIERIRLSQAGPESAVVPQRPDTTASEPGGTSALEEIVVTAQKRAQRLLDVPVPVTAVNTDALTSNNQVRIQDYYTRVPSLSIATDDFGAPNATIRGLTTGTQTNPTVAIVVDDLPYSSASALAFGQQVPDFDPSDLARIEVLRGPQGTLYGANSLGGLIKFVTVDPSTEYASGRVQFGVSDVHNGDDLGYNGRAAFNTPLSETVAVRVSAFHRVDPGYIDDPSLGISGTNEVRSYGARVSLLWQPSENTTLKLGAAYQETEAEGSPSADITLGDLQQIGVKGVGGYDRKSQIYSAMLNTRLGAVDVVSITGYSIGEYVGAFGGANGSHSFSAIADALFNVDGFGNLLSGTNKKFSQELRFSGELGAAADWRVGAYYSDETNSPTQQLLTARVPSTGRIAGVIANIDNPSTFEEYAAFADLTFHVTDRFDVQVGGRQSYNEQSYRINFGGRINELLGRPDPFIQPEVTSDDSSFTFLVTPQFKLTPDLMIYARAASGYRPGGPNINGNLAGTGLEYGPDTTLNFDLGIKGEALGRRLAFDVATYYIDWQDIQLYLIAQPSGLSYNANGSGAVSYGIEASLEARPTDGLSVAAWLAVGSAELNEDLPPFSTVGGLDGDRLPYSADLSGNLSLEQRFDFASGWAAFAGGAVSYIGARKGPFTGTGVTRGTLPDYARVDLNLRLERAAWTFNVYANNLLDRRGFLNGGPGTFNPTQYQYIQPRTLGVSAAWSF